MVVDLDGTLIRSDMMWESMARLLRRNPAMLFPILWWWWHGRAYLKQQLAARVQVDPTQLACNESFLAWLWEQKKSGRKIILATASDRRMAEPVAAHHAGLFEEVLASDGTTNLRSENKLRALNAKYGERAFDYAGNSSADYPVWRGSRQAVVVNASPTVQREAAACTTIGAKFCEGYSPFTIPRSVLTELFLRSGYLLAILSGLLLALAFPKFQLAGFAWVAPAILMFAVQKKSRADALRVGYLSGLTFWLISLSWLLLIPYTWHHLPLLPGLGWLALAAFIALYTGLWAWLMAGFDPTQSTWGRRMLWTLLGAAVWVAGEMIRARFLGGFPWSFLGVSQYQLIPLIQIAKVTGVYGVSFLIMWQGLSLYCGARQLLANPARRHVWQAEVALPLVTLMLIYTAGIWQANRAATSPAAFRVLMIQPAIPQTVLWDPVENARTFSAFLQQNEQAMTNEIDLVIWPESAVPEMNDFTCRAISDFAKRHHVWLVLNGEDATTSRTATNYFNAAFLVNPKGELTTTYHKQKLVIFGEYVPCVDWLPFLKYLTPIVGGWTPGTEPGHFSFSTAEALAPSEKAISIITANTPARGTVQAAPLICFEDTFATVARGATQSDVDFLINLTNDGWFGDSSEQWQHMANSVFRTVENGVPLLRCANNGVTCLIDAQGRVTKTLRDAQGSVYGVGNLRLEVPLLSPGAKSSPTWYNQRGDVFGWGCVGITICLLGQRWLESRKRAAKP
ncbi:MAG TPA: apolipoprotein N-acyltransferase [Verrucomicrobiae bacterium]